MEIWLNRILDFSLELNEPGDTQRQKVPTRTVHAKKLIPDIVLIRYDTEYFLVGIIDFSSSLHPSDDEWMNEWKLKG